MSLNRKARRALKAIGLGKEAPKDPQSLQKEYFQACAAAGELQYKIGEFQSQLKELNETIRKLNVAYAEVLTEQRAAAASNSGGGEQSTPPSSPSEAK